MDKVAERIELQPEAEGALVIVQEIALEMQRNPAAEHPLPSGHLHEPLHQQPVLLNNKQRQLAASPRI